jgi:RNA polymerase sigma-70 factor (ECF subfamily)
MTQEEFVRQVQTNQGIIQKICRLYCQNQPDREDLFQEIVVQLWKDLPKFKGQSKFTTWMYRVALNTAISDFRKKKRSLPVSDAEVTLLEARTAQADVNKEEQLNTLYVAISQLPEIDKAIVMLYLEDKSYEEIEDILGINTNNLRVKMNRIREKLRQLTKNISDGAR